MRHARWAMGAIGMGFDAALVTAGVCVGAALAGGMAAGDEQRGGADEQGEEFEVFHFFICWFWFVPTRPPGFGLWVAGRHGHSMVLRRFVH